MLTALLLASSVQCDMLGEMAWQTQHLRNKGYALSKLLNEELDEQVIHYTKGIYDGKYGSKAKTAYKLVYKECMRG